MMPAAVRLGGARLSIAGGRRHARPCAAPLLRRLGCQPGRVRPTIRYCATPAGRVAYSTLGAWPAAVVRLGLGHPSARAAGAVFLRQLHRAPGRAVHRDPLRQARVRPVGPGRGRPVVRRAGGGGAGGGRRGGRRPLPPVRGLAGGPARRGDRGEVPRARRGAGAVRDVRQRRGSGACRGQGLDRGPGAGPLGPGLEDADRHLHPGPQRARTSRRSPGFSGPAPRPPWRPGCWRSTTRPTSGRCSRRSARGRRSCTARRTRPPGSSWGARSPR